MAKKKSKLDLRFSETKETIIQIAEALSKCQLTNRAIAVLVKDAHPRMKISDIEAVLNELPRLQEKYLK